MNTMKPKTKNNKFLTFFTIFVFLLTATLPALALAENAESENKVREEIKPNIEMHCVFFYVGEKQVLHYDVNDNTVFPSEHIPKDPAENTWPADANGFLGWYIDNVPSNIDDAFKFNFEAPITKDTKIYARFSFPIKYGVSFFNSPLTESEENSIIHSVSVNGGENVPSFPGDKVADLKSPDAYTGEWLYSDEAGAPLDGPAPVNFGSDKVDSAKYLVPVFEPESGVNPPVNPPVDPPVNHPVDSNPIEVPPITGTPVTTTPTPPATPVPDNEKDKPNTGGGNSGNTGGGNSGNTGGGNSGNTSGTTPQNNVGSSLGVPAGTNNVTEEAAVASVDTAASVIIPPSKTPLYPNHEISLSPIFPPLESGEVISAFNFALAGGTIILMVMLFITYFIDPKRGLGEVNKHGGLRLLSIVPVIAAMVILVPTQDLNKPIQMADEFSLHFAAILLVQLIITILARKSYSYDDFDEAL